METHPSPHLVQYCREAPGEALGIILHGQPLLPGQWLGPVSDVLSQSSP